MSNDVKREKKEIIIPENRDFKGVWIPERLYLTREFTPNEKFLLIEIYSLTRNKTRQCFANNKHFADFVGLKENTVQKMMLKFETEGYIKRIYEYKENSKEINRRIILLTDKFYQSFINESENTYAEPMENNQHGNGFYSSGGSGKKSMGEVDKKSEISNTSFKYNNNLSNTNLSNEADTSNKFDGKVNTAFLGKKSVCSQNKKTKSELQELQQDMIDRFINIGKQYNISEKALKNIINAFIRYLDRYTEYTGKIHPILKDETLDNIFVTLGTLTDKDFLRLAEHEPEENQISYLESMVDEHFNAKHEKDTDFHITHFANQDYLEKMALHIVEW